MHADNHIPPSCLGTRGVDDSEALVRGRHKLRTLHINPSDGMNIGCSIQFLFVCLHKIRLFPQRPTHIQMIIRHFSKRFQCQIQPLVYKAVATEPEKILPARAMIFLLRPWVQDGWSLRKRIDRLVQVPERIDIEIIPAYGHVIRVFVCQRVLHDPIAPLDRNPSSLL